MISFVYATSEQHAMTMASDPRNLTSEGQAQQRADALNEIQDKRTYAAYKVEHGSVAVYGAKAIIKATRQEPLPTLDDLEDDERDMLKTTHGKNGVPELDAIKDDQ